MKIVRLTADQQKEYFDLAQKEGGVFNSSLWVSIYGNALHLYGILDDSGKLMGGFHLFRHKLFGLEYVKLPPYTPHIGLFFKKNALNPANALSFEKSIIQLISDFLKENGGHLTTLAFSRDFIDMQPFCWNKFKVYPNYTYVLQLSGDLSIIQARMSPERRNDIKRASKDGLVSVLCKEPAIIAELVGKTFERQEKSYRVLMVEKILFDFSNENNSFAFVTYRNNQPIAAAFCIHDDKTAYYLLGGYDSNNRHSGAGALAVWNSIQHSKNIGLSEFDFEGSMIPNVERYFRGFGADLKPYFFVSNAKLILKQALSILRPGQF